ncbi:hypothetical protein ABZP36_015538 [Zizania latifolia]
MMGHTRWAAVAAPRLPPFAMEQYEELEQQALIYKYLVISMPVLLDLLPIRRGLNPLASCFYHHKLIPAGSPPPHPLWPQLTRFTLLPPQADNILISCQQPHSRAEQEEEQRGRSLEEQEQSEEEEEEQNRAAQRKRKRKRKEGQSSARDEEEEQSRTGEEEEEQTRAEAEAEEEQIMAEMDGGDTESYLDSGAVEQR